MNVIDEFEKRYNKTAAYSIGDNHGRVVFEYQESRVICYLQIWGAPMVKGTARGYNYDRQTEAFHQARAKLQKAGAVRDTETDESERWTEFLWRADNLKAACII